MNLHNSEYLSGCTNYYGVDCETYDPFLFDKGPSWVWNEGEILCTGLHNGNTNKVKALSGNGGKYVYNMLLNEKSAIIGANIMYDIGWIAYENQLKIEDTKAKIIDVQIVESLIDNYGRFTLDALARKYLGEQKKSVDLVCICLKRGLKGDFRKHLKALWYEPDKQLQKVYREKILEYVASDADQPYRIWEKQCKIIDDNNLWYAFDLNMETAFITACMKQHGVRIDYDKWKINSEKAIFIQDKMEEAYFHKYGYVNVNSSKQLSKLFEEHNVPFKYKIRVKGYRPANRKFVNATDKFTSGELKAQQTILKKWIPSVRIEKGELNIYMYKKYVDKVVSFLAGKGYETTANPSINKFTFMDTQAKYPVSADTQELKQVKGIIQKFLGPNFERFFAFYKDGSVRLHGNFNPVGARKTGRLSSSKPNLQNIPSKTILFQGTEHEVNLATMCREIFIPDEGRVFVKLDYSGQENVLQAHFAVGDNGKHIRKMYTDNPRLDEHSYVTNISGLADIYGDNVGRKYAKNLRFGKSYGMQLPSIMRNFGWDEETAKEVENLVVTASPWVYETMAILQDMLKGEGRFTGKARPYIKTLAGRIIRIHNKNDAYKFYNYLIQGSASDMIKAAMIKLWKTRTVDRLLLTVHDENCLDVSKDEEGFKRIDEMRLIMENAVQLKVPIICDPEIGTDWGHVEGQEKGDDGYPVETVIEMCRRVAKKKNIPERNFDDVDAYVTSHYSFNDEDEDE